MREREERWRREKRLKNMEKRTKRNQVIGNKKRERSGYKTKNEKSGTMRIKCSTKG